MASSFEKFRRVALLGFTATGKTSLASKFVHCDFAQDYGPTIQGSFHTRVSVSRKTYQLEIMDSSGQDLPCMMPLNYTMNIDGYILVYSITSPHSYGVCKTLHETLLERTGQATIPLVLVGNKSDLAGERKVSVEEGQELAARMQAVFVESSAKDDVNVGEIFTAIVTEVEKARGNVARERKGCVIA